MDENLVEKILQRDVCTRSIFLGAFARDELPEKPPYPSCFIINTDPRSKPGRHWLAFFFSKNGFCDFFDSYGLPPSFYRLETFLNRNAKGWNWNKRRLQGFSDFCGLYSVLFLLFKSRKKDGEFFKEFYFNYVKNDKKILKYLKKFSK